MGRRKKGVISKHTLFALVVVTLLLSVVSSIVLVSNVDRSDTLTAGEQSISSGDIALKIREDVTDAASGIVALEVVESTG